MDQRANPTYRPCAPSSSPLTFWKPGGACFVERPSLRVVFERRRGFRQQKTRRKSIAARVPMQSSRNFWAADLRTRQDMTIDKIALLIRYNGGAWLTRCLGGCPLPRTRTIPLVPHLVRDSRMLDLVVARLASSLASFFQNRNRVETLWCLGSQPGTDPWRFCLSRPLSWTSRGESEVSKASARGGDTA